MKKLITLAAAAAVAVVVARKIKARRSTKELWAEVTDPAR